MTTRYFVRTFTGEPLSREAIPKMLDMARRALYATPCLRFVVSIGTHTSRLCLKSHC